jgi:O-6-methylguanine DNA methyltransferase
LLISKNKELTRFEKDVYKAVLKIPRGETRSYAWVAKRIGHKLAARAVGNALNKNPYPVIVPCHRIIKSDGSIGGFLKGVKAKRKLLASEGVDCL